MANYDANYNPGADPRFDDAPFTGEENAEDYAADVVGADTSAETAAREDRDATLTDSQERPSKCMWISSIFRKDFANEAWQLRSTPY